MQGVNMCNFHYWNRNELKVALTDNHANGGAIEIASSRHLSNRE